MKRLLLLFTTLTMLLAPSLYGQKHKITFEVEGDGRIAQAWWYDAAMMNYALTSGMELDEGTNYFLQAQANDGAVFDHWSVNGEQVFGEILDRYIHEDLHVIAHFSSTGKTVYTVTLKSNDTDMGTLEGHYQEIDASGWAWNMKFDGSKQIEEGTEVRVVATPRPNFAVDQWTVNGQVIPTPDNPNEYTFTVNGSTDIYVSFKPGKSGFPVTYTAGEHGRIVTATVYTGSGPTSFNSGDYIAQDQEIELVAAPEAGYMIDQWLVNGVADTRYDEQTDFRAEIKGETEIKVTFKPIPVQEYVVKFSADEGARVTASYMDENFKIIIPKSGDKIKAGTKVKFSLEIEEGYEFEGWTINGAAREDLNGKTEFTHEITSTVSVKAKIRKGSSEPVTFPVTFSANEGATMTATYKDAEGKEVTLKSGDKVETGTDVTFALQIQDGYVLEGWTINGKARKDLDEKTEFTLKVEAATEVKAQIKKHEATEAIVAAGLQIYVADGVLYVAGAAAPVEVAIYDAEGVRLYVGAVADRLDLSFLPDGLYFVVAQGTTVKVIK